MLRKLQRKERTVPLSTTKTAFLVEVARDPEVGTPTYVYDLDAIAAEARELLRALEDSSGLVAYAVKANSAGPIVRTLAHEGCGADVVSGAELELSLACGVLPSKIVYSGVAKTNDEIDLAISRTICAVQAESVEEIARLETRAAALGRRVRVSVRVNPGFEAQAIGTHVHITTGHDEAKFGVPLADVDLAVRNVHAAAHLDLVGVTCHLGSQLTEVTAYVDGARILFDLGARALSLGAPLEFIDTGGGFGIDYGAGCAVRPADFVRAVRAAQRAKGLEKLQLHLEPGRALVGPHGVLVARVIQTKTARAGGRLLRWLMIDAGMNDLIRPALYQARHRIVSLEGQSGPRVKWRVVGPVCESSDDFGEHELPEAVPELVAILDCGAYGYTMASQYNSRALPVEVFVRGGRVVARTERAPRGEWVKRRAGLGE